MSRPTESFNSVQKSDVLSVLMLLLVDWLELLLFCVVLLFCTVVPVVPVVVFLDLSAMEPDVTRNSEVPLRIPVG